MEGILHVPPERGTIIGRAIWKPRYVVVASTTDARLKVRRHRQQSNPSTSTSTTPPTSTANPARVSTPASPCLLSAEHMCLSVFKNRGDCEPIQQHAISSITDCQVQMLAHRKQGPILPTLVISVSPDPITDKLRKRRSSRTAGLTSTKDTCPSTLWFRPAEDNHHKQTLLEWCRFIQGLMMQLGTVISSAPAPGPLSPITPASPTFVNPFSSHKDRVAQPAQPTTQPAQPPQQQPPSSRDDRGNFTESPSLRSRRSDLSHTSSNLPPHVTTSGYSSNSSSNAPFNTSFFQSQQRPTDLPSPATTVHDFPPEFGEGFANRPSRERDSASSPVTSMAASTGAVVGTGLLKSSSPPAPRETILDRAFQMRRIPGSQREYIPGEEKLSSLARFDALMRMAEERKRQRLAVTDTKETKETTSFRAEVKRSATAAPFVGQSSRSSRSNSYNHQPQFQPQFPSQSNKHTEVPKSGWDLDEDSHDDDDGSTEGEDEGVLSGEDDDDDIPERMLGRNGRRAESASVYSKGDPGIDIAPKALRALDFIAGRHYDEYASRKKKAADESDDDEFEATSSTTPKARGVLSYDAQTLKTLDSGPLPYPGETLRPQTGYVSRSRPAIAQRTHSQPQLAALQVNNYINSMNSCRSHKAAAQAISIKTPITPSMPSPICPPSAPPLPHAATAHSLESPAESPGKRLSFNDFTRRLSSSTSSLLLVQTNTSTSTLSGNSHSHNGATLEPQYTTSAASPPTRHVSGSCISNPPLPPPPTAVERCGWRSSVNVISTEGGFL